MKKIIYFVFFFLLFTSQEVTKGQTNCEVEVNQTELSPAYLESDWQNTKTISVAVLFVDFPDGRINGIDQPYFTYQLSQINDTDAAAEVGTKVIGGDTVPVCSKYTYFDRWNMYFDSLGNFNSTANPDWDSHKDSAWGSFKEYWKEASDGKLRIQSALIRPSATGDSRFKTGIINNYTEIETGRYIIKSIRLRKNKYIRPTNFYGYFQGYPYTTGQGSTFTNIGIDALDILDSLRNNNPNEYPFDHRTFMQSGGKIIVVFAGGARGVGGATNTGYDFMVVRGRGDPLVNMQDLLEPDINLLKSSRMDGIAVSCHEFGHNAFGWAHTYASRYDLMCGNFGSQLNCPALPNPVYRMKQGWLQPMAIENSQQLNNLTPIENSYKCGVITIFGKPSAAPDWGTGESYVIENRQMLKFDRKIVDTLFFNRNPQFAGFTGGLLVWHYSPYYIINTLEGADSKIRLKTPRSEDTLIGNNLLGDVRHFFTFLPTDPDPIYHNLLQIRTFSGGGFQTGIELNNISQNNTIITLNINYTIAPPVNYDGIIYFRDYNRHFNNYSGKVFYHEEDTAGFFNIEPGTIIEHHGTNRSFNPYVKCNTIEAKGSENFPIKFRGVGFTDIKTKFRGLTFNRITTHLSIDTLILNNIQIENVEPDKTSLIVGIGTGIINSIPVVLNNIDMAETTSANEIALLNSTVSKINLKDKRIAILKGINFNGDLNLENGKINFDNSNCSFKDNCGINTVNTIISGITDTFNVQNGFINWIGIASDGGSIDLQNSIIRNALTGIYITGATSEIFINNSKFENNRDYDISIYKTSNESDEKPRISNNTFSQDNNTNVKIASIIVNECPNISIDSNTIIKAGYSGILLMNVESSLINYNIITGGNLSESRSSGIVSYNSNGYYNCNSVSQCMEYGILLDNSQPVLFNNEIFVNGIGLFLTNNSNPIMTSAYLNNETYVIGGYNDIHHNAGKEIYCNNSKINNSVPVMHKGYNSVEDSVGLLPDTLIYNKVSSSTPHIDAIGNYWGGSSPVGRLIPDNSFTYDPYLTSQFSHDCVYASEPADNASLPIEYLLLGNIMKNQQQENFDIALNYSYQLLALQNSEISPVISFNDIFTSNLLSNGNFINLENYYLSLISQYPEDSVINNKLLNLSIESKIARNELEDAISEYDEILNTNTDEEVIFYASIDRSRAIRLLLDSLLSHYQGDNSGQNIEQMYDNAINYEIRINNSDKELNSETQREINAKGKDNKSKVKTRDENNFTFLKKNIAEKIRNFAHLSEKERRSLIVEKNILDLSVNNYVEGIASIKDKLRYINQKTQEIPRTYKLYQNYPNPFNPVTHLEFEISKLGFISLKVYDILGKEVKTLVNEIKPAGIYKVQFDGSNLPSGVYFYMIEAGDFIQVKSMILIK